MVARTSSGPQVGPGFEEFLKEHRVATFDQWPFASGCSCTPDRMAEAGFIHCPTENAPDVAQCFICFKELEGWEPDDDPMEEHRKHSPNCAFLALQKDIKDLTIQEFMRLCRERMKALIRKEINQKINDLEKRAEKTCNAIQLLRM
ncbi:baculoviral IAP repeat-containing protein 5 [Lacerta agilis]|uniref:baculoviral IAP repeat-containing protein 5 n=1 Tax=Lacerta agilis TaxID=80427 RepID=UPI00141A33ED|nr:baculoviral IAP repeat-containing protein 5 [Lacerta agilis]